MDTIKSSNSLLIECMFRDGDTRTITLRSPKKNISASEIQNLEVFMLENKIIIGDKEGSDFWKIKRAVKRNSATTYLDLG